MKKILLLSVLSAVLFSGVVHAQTLPQEDSSVLIEAIDQGLKGGLSMVFLASIIWLVSYSRRKNKNNVSRFASTIKPEASVVAHVIKPSEIVSKQKIATIILCVSFLFLLSIIPPADSVAYFIGNLIRVVLIWTVILGFVAYLIWRIGFKKRQGLFLFIFSLLFFSATVFEIGGRIYLGYAETKLLETINTPEFRERLDGTFKESGILKQESTPTKVVAPRTNAEPLPSVSSVPKYLNTSSNESPTETPTKASGFVKTYNDAAVPQRLIKNTRFASPDGKIFRLLETVTIPASGSIEATIVAEETGADYNIPPSTFKMPGLMGAPAYDFIYARSFMSMEGGK